MEETSVILTKNGRVHWLSRMYAQFHVRKWKLNQNFYRSDETCNRKKISQDNHCTGSLTFVMFTCKFLTGKQVSSEITLAIHPYRPSSLVSLVDSIHCRHKADECSSLLLRQGSACLEGFAILFSAASRSGVTVQ